MLPGPGTFNLRRHALTWHGGRPDKVCWSLYLLTQHSWVVCLDNLSPEVLISQRQVRRLAAELGIYIQPVSQKEWYYNLFVAIRRVEVDAQGRGRDAWLLH